MSLVASIVGDGIAGEEPSHDRRDGNRARSK